LIHNPIKLNLDSPPILTTANIKLDIIQLAPELHSGIFDSSKRQIFYNVRVRYRTAGVKMGNLWLGAFVGFLVTVLLGWIIPGLGLLAGHLIGGLVAGVIARGGIGRGALAGFLAGIFGGIILAVIAIIATGTIGGILGGLFGGILGVLTGVVLGIIAIIVSIVGGIISPSAD
jgi:hypothetical protein